MSISLLVLSSPFDTQASYTAYRYAKAALTKDIKIGRIFFYQTGVHNSSALACPPRDEFNLNQAWIDLANNHQTELLVCIAAAARRGLIDEAEAKRHQKTQHNLAAPFELAGLGQLVEALALSDKVISFGS